MQNDMKSIVLISSDPVATADVAAALRNMPLVKLEEHEGTLAAMNGTAVRLAAMHDMVIFKTDGGSPEDLVAIAALNKALAADSVILALANDDISLAAARALTQAGVDEVLPYPVSPEELRDHVARWTKPVPVELSTGQQGRQSPQGKVITITQARGGVGATTLAVNLADRLLDRAGLIKKVARNRVALVDLDLQFGAVASFLDLQPNDALYQLATVGSVPDAAFTRAAMQELSSGMSVMTAPSSFVPMEALRAEQVASLIDNLRAEFDYVVVDLPRTLVDWVSPVLQRTDRLMLVTDSSVPSVRQARRLIDFYLEDSPSMPIEIVINNEKKPLITRRHHIEAAKVLERPLNAWIAHDPVAAREAIDRGAPLSSAAPRSALARGINALGRTTIATLSKAVQPARLQITKN